MNSFNQNQPYTGFEEELNNKTLFEDEKQKLDDEQQHLKNLQAEINLAQQNLSNRIEDYNERLYHFENPQTLIERMKKNFKTESYHKCLVP